MISHIFRGDKDLTLDQGIKVAEYLGLSFSERDYFLNLIQIERSASHELKNYFKQKNHSIKQESKDLRSKLPASKKLDERDKALFYSSWVYSALRLLSSIKTYQSEKELLNAFNLPHKRVKEVLGFLIEKGLCLQNNSQIQVGPTHIHLESTSPLIYRHHHNWRQKAMERHEQLGPKELMFSAPLTIGENDIEKVRELTTQYIEKVREVVDQTSPDTLMCLNIDWFKVK